MRDIGGAVLDLEIGEQDDELISSHACDSVGLADAGTEPVTNLEKKSVPRLVAERVVDALEVVEIDDHDGDVVVVTRRALDTDLEPVAEEGPGGEIGERIVVGEILEVFVRLFTLGDVVAYCDAADGGATVVLEGGDGELHWEASAVLSDVGPFPGDDGIAFEEGSEDLVIGYDFAAEFGSEGAHCLGDLVGVMQQGDVA